MTAIVPNVKVYLEDTPTENRAGMASKIAVIGAFNSTATKPIECGSLTEAYKRLGRTKTNESQYKGLSCLKHLFVGASSIIAVNITVKTGSGNQEVIDKELTTEKLASALSKIKGEDFDMLFIAENIDNTAITMINTFLEENFEMKTPAGYVVGLTRANSEAYLATAEIAGEFCYGILTQQLTVNGTELSIVDSGAYYCGVLAGLNVGSSMTMKAIPYVTNVSPELSFENGGNGLPLLEAGITTVKCQNRIAGKYIVVNSEQPNGLDVYINRTRDYVIKEFNLHEFLGERNREPTLDEIIQELDRVKELCVNTLDLLTDISYEVVKKSANCVDVYINSLLFSGIITEIDVYVTIEVE